MPKLSSREEKQQRYTSHGEIEKWLYVSELKALLEELDDDDWVTPNQNMCLLVSREGSTHCNSSIGVIEFSSGEFSRWDKKEG